eukprot:CAMPEP_0176413576 /NCGR_PEP_ID=MMETSP0127-20121128/4775_1 /TAXON_ID=938130 /ORGANISM="Platyophrya macrostoma, Strain WH" /LENGTH=371 /DNA_ID=CAMNT_0017793371 /DNA_START=207 /DNA_END=1322 /DNA_ORIENTATION=-
MNQTLVKHFGQKNIFKSLIAKQKDSRRISKILKTIVSKNEEACTWFFETKQSFEHLGANMSKTDSTHLKEALDLFCIVFSNLSYEQRDQISQMKSSTHLKEALDLFCVLFSNLSYEQRDQISQMKSTQNDNILELAIKRLDQVSLDCLNEFLIQLCGFLTRMSGEKAKKTHYKKLASLTLKQVVSLKSYATYKKNDALQRSFDDLVESIETRKQKAGASKKSQTDNKMSLEDDEEEEKEDRAMKSKKKKAKTSKEAVRKNTSKRGRVLRNDVSRQTGAGQLDAATTKTSSRKTSRVRSLSGSRSRSKTANKRSSVKSPGRISVGKIFKRTSTIEDVIERTRNMLNMREYGRGKREIYEGDYSDNTRKILKQ